MTAKEDLIISQIKEVMEDYDIDSNWYNLLECNLNKGYVSFINDHNKVIEVSFIVDNEDSIINYQFYLGIKTS